jgi:hypothetical protein
VAEDIDFVREFKPLLRRVLAQVNENAEQLVGILR